MEAVWEKLSQPLPPGGPATCDVVTPELRRRLAAGQDCAAALPESVRAVIRREGLYAAPEPPEQPRRCIHPDACP